LLEPDLSRESLLYQEAEVIPATTHP